MTRLEKFKRMVISQDAHIKITLGAIIGLVFVVIGAMIYLTDIKQDVSNNKQTIVVLYEDIADDRQDIETLQNDNVVLKISVAEINTKLTYINKSQIEIIQLLKESN